MGGVDVQLQAFLILTLQTGEQSASRTGRFFPLSKLLPVFTAMKIVPGRWPEHREKKRTLLLQEI